MKDTFAVNILNNAKMTNTSTVNPIKKHSMYRAYMVQCVITFIYDDFSIARIAETENLNMLLCVIEHA